MTGRIIIITGAPATGKRTVVFTAEGSQEWLKDESGQLAFCGKRYCPKT